MPQLDPTTFAPQLFWLLVTFFLLYLVMWKLVIPKIGEILQDRQIRIDNDLDKAEHLKIEAEGAREAYEKLIIDGREKALEIIKTATEQISTETTEQHDALTEKLAVQTSKAEKQINIVKEKALDEIRLVATEVTQAAARRLTDQEISYTQAQDAVSTVIEEGKFR